MWGLGERGRDRFCKAWILDLLSWQFTQVNCTVNNVFCAGHAMMTDGRVLVAGGTDAQQRDDGEGWGTRYATVLVPDATPAGAHWEEVRSMGPTVPEYGRWYPTVTLLADERVLVVTGTQKYVRPRRTYNKKVQL
ncbi:MAG: hypothetical protein C4341_04075 [Armatimonadota bacterium]